MEIDSDFNLYEENKSHNDLKGIKIRTDCSCFPSHRALILVGLYLFGIIMGVFSAFILKKTAFRGEAVPFVMELPNYRMPGLKNVAQLHHRLYTPCVAAIAAVRRELGAKWAITMALAQCAFAWLISLAVYMIANVFC